MSESTDNLMSQIEAIVLASDEPVSLQKLRDLLNNDLLKPEAPSSDIRAVLAKLEIHYQSRGINIVQVAGGWQFRTAPAHAELVQGLWHTKPPRLSRSALETLAIIAYRQPTTRAEIEALRGVRVSSQMIATLQERGWIKVLGRKEVPGRPHLYGTGKPFLVDFGLNGLKDLPDSSQLMDDDEVQQSLADKDKITNKQLNIANIEQHSKQILDNSMETNDSETSNKTETSTKSETNRPEVNRPETNRSEKNWPEANSIETGQTTPSNQTSHI